MLLTPLPIAGAPGFPADAIWGRLDPAIPWKGDWADFRHRQQGEFLHELAKYAPFDIGLSHVGLSDEGRVLHTLRFGNGPRKVLVWARQHGNEADCTAGLAMALYELILHCEEPQYAYILNRLELGVFPMVNPDGVARFTRRNAQGIDINRDAVAQATPEGRAIMTIKESLKPEFCFNLHDMSPRKSTRDGKLVALAFQAGPFEQRDIDNPVRLKAKKVCALMADAASAHAPGHLARYTADYMHRAFGDSMMRMGVSSILIEAGGWYEDKGGDDFVRRLFALTLLRGLYAVAAAEDEPATGEGYDAIPFDSGAQFLDVVLEKGQLLNAMGSPPFRADLAFNVNAMVGRSGDSTTTLGTLENIGDLEDERARERRDLSGQIVFPGFVGIAPSLVFERDRPSAEEAAEFLRAGVTTVVCGFGPFGSNRAREQWMETVGSAPPPLNLIAFERVSSLREIRQRHGTTELAGLLVNDLEIGASDLLNFLHLFHPAHHSAIDSPYQGRMIGIDVLFQGAASPSATHMHLHLTALEGQGRSGRTTVRPEELRLIVDEFLRSPSQITVSVDSLDDRFDWLPFLMNFGGLSHGRRPHRNFLGNILRLYNATDASGVVTALNMLTVNNARAFRLGNAGKLEIGQRADLVVFSDSVINGGEHAFGAEPALVLLNGREVWNRAEHRFTPARGQWHFASMPQVR